MFVELGIFHSIQIRMSSGKIVRNASDTYVLGIYTHAMYAKILVCICEHVDQFHGNC